MEYQVLKQFVAFGQALKPGDIFDGSNVNISRMNKLIAQRFVTPVQIREGKVESVSPPKEIEQPKEHIVDPAKSQAAKDRWAKRKAALGDEIL